ncbi:hypothetical protein BKA80DRAFT_145663 [Phyllosticta citrichinensis]
MGLRAASMRILAPAVASSSSEKPASAAAAPPAGLSRQRHRSPSESVVSWSIVSYRVRIRRVPLDTSLSAPPSLVAIAIYLPIVFSACRIRHALIHIAVLSTRLDRCVRGPRWFRNRWLFLAANALGWVGLSCSVLGLDWIGQLVRIFAGRT